MRTEEYANRYNSENVNYSCDDAKFSGHLVYLCLKKLVSFIEEFQVKELPEEEVISRKIDLHNSYSRSKLPKADMIQFYLLLLKYGSFKEAGKYSRYSRATIYRYKDRFETIGITETSIKPMENHLVPETSINLKEYHSVLVYENDLLRGIKVN